MKVWDIVYYSDKPNTTPAVLYKGNLFNLKLESKLREEVFNYFYLTHRDKKKEIKELEEIFNNNTYKNLYEMVFPPKKVKHRFEYLVDLLNLFEIEIDFKGIL